MQLVSRGIGLDFDLLVQIILRIFILDKKKIQNFDFNTFNNHLNIFLGLTYPYLSIVFVFYL